MRNLRNDIKNYFAANGTVSRWWYPTGAKKFHYEQELRILDENLEINPKWEVLDIGTGKGRLAIYFAKKGCRVTALDISREMLSIGEEQAKRNAVDDKIDFILGDAENLPFRGNKFDIVCCMETLDHIPHIEKAISEMTNKIKVGGLYLLTFVPETSLYWRIITIYDKLKSRERLPTIARAYPIDFIYKIVELGGSVKIEKKWGISLLYPIKWVIPIWLSKSEKILKPYYSNSSFVRRCTHILMMARKRMVTKNA